MADSKKKEDGVQVNDDPAPGAAETITHETPHPADESSAPGPYDDLSAERPPVSTTQSDVDVAQSLASGAGAHTPPADADEQAALNPPAGTESKVVKAPKGAG